MNEDPFSTPAARLALVAAGLVGILLGLLTAGWAWVPELGRYVHLA